MKAHLCFIPKKGIKSYAGKPKRKGLLAESQVLAYIEEHRKANEAIRKESSHPLVNSKNKKGAMASPSYLNLEHTKGHPFLSIPQQQPILSHKRAKGLLETSFHNEGRQIAKQDIARCIYANGLAFNVVHSPC